MGGPKLHRGTIGLLAERSHSFPPRREGKRKLKDRIFWVKLKMPLVCTLLNCVQSGHLQAEHLVLSLVIKSSLYMYFFLDVSGLILSFPSLVFIIVFMSQYKIMSSLFVISWLRSYLRFLSCIRNSSGGTSLTIYGVSVDVVLYVITYNAWINILWVQV